MSGFTTRHAPAGRPATRSARTLLAVLFPLLQIALLLSPAPDGGLALVHVTLAATAAAGAALSLCSVVAARSAPAVPPTRVRTALRDRARRTAFLPQRGSRRQGAHPSPSARSRPPGDRRVGHLAGRSLRDPSARPARVVMPTFPVPSRPSAAPGPRHDETPEGSPLSVFATLVEQLADLLRPLFGLSAAAAAIIAFTALVRLLVHPLSRAAARGQKARAALQPRIAELRRKHGKNPEKLQKAVLELHAEEKVSPAVRLPAQPAPAPRVLPALPPLLQRHDRRRAQHAAHPPTPRRAPRRPVGGRPRRRRRVRRAGLVYLGLFAVVTVVAYVSYRLSRRMTEASAALAGTAGADPQVPGAAAMGGVMKVMPFMSFLTLVTVAVVPLAAALYVVTSTTWSVIERSVLYR